jgi:hypothetical protein
VGQYHCTAFFIAGWPSLATRFRSAQTTDGERFRFASGSIGSSIRFPVSYRSCLFFTVTDTGFLLSAFFLFRLLSPPLFIPWEQVESVTEQRIWFLQTAVISIRDSSTKIMVRGRVAQAIMKVYENFSSHHTL